MQLIFLGLSICLHSEILWYYSNKSFLDADTLSCRWGLEVRHVKIQSRLVKIQLRSLAQEGDEEAQTIGALFLSRLLRRNVCECLASLLPPSLSFPHTSHCNLPLTTIDLFLSLGFGCFLRWTKFRQGKIADLWFEWGWNQEKTIGSLGLIGWTR